MKSTPSTLLKACVFTALLTHQSIGQTINFSFTGDTWNYASGSPTTGFVTQTPATSQTQSSGSVTKSGVTVKFGASFVGTTNSGANFDGNTGSSMTNASLSQNPPGFLLSSANNDSSGLTNGVSSDIGGGTAANYQRWHFEFSSPIILNNFLIQDIDNVSGVGAFRDILGAEAFVPTGYNSAFTGNTLNTSSLPTAGSGVDPTFGLFVGTQLQNYSINVGSQSLSVLTPNVDTVNPSSSAAVRANVSFGTTPIKAFSVYSLSNTGGTHRMALEQGGFTVAVVPETSSAILALVSTLGFLRRRR